MYIGIIQKKLNKSLDRNLCQIGIRHSTSIPCTDKLCLNKKWNPYKTFSVEILCSFLKRVHCTFESFFNLALSVKWQMKFYRDFFSFSLQHSWPSDSKQTIHWPKHPDPEVPNLLKNIKASLRITFCPIGDSVRRRGSPLALTDNSVGRLLCERQE